MENALTDSSSIRIRVIKNLGSKLPGLNLLYVAVLLVFILLVSIGNKQNNIQTLRNKKTNKPKQKTNKKQKTKTKTNK